MQNDLLAEAYQMITGLADLFTDESPQEKIYRLGLLDAAAVVKHLMESRCSTAN